MLPRLSREVEGRCSARQPSRAHRASLFAGDELGTCKETFCLLSDEVTKYAAKVREEGLLTADTSLIFHRSRYGVGFIEATCRGRDEDDHAVRDALEVLDRMLSAVHFLILLAEHPPASAVDLRVRSRESQDAAHYLSSWARPPTF